MRVRQSKYSDEFRADALNLIRRGDRSFRALADALGVNSWTLRDWYKKDEMAKKQKAGTKKVPLDEAAESGSEESELVRLKRENQLLRENEALRMDREMLKKAAASSTSQRNSAASVLAGVVNPRVFRGRSLSWRATAFKSACE
jgi:transposase